MAPSIIDQPNLRDERENAQRRRILGAYRAYGRHPDYFKSFPPDVDYTDYFEGFPPRRAVGTSPAFQAGVGAGPIHRVRLLGRIVQRIASASCCGEEHLLASAGEPP